MFLFKSTLLESFFQAFLDSSSRGAPASRVIQVELPQQGYVQRSLLGNQEPRSGRKSAGTEQITTAGKPTSCAGLLLPVHTCLVSQGTVNRSVKSLSLPASTPFHSSFSITLRYVHGVCLAALRTEEDLIHGSQDQKSRPELQSF